MFPVTEAPATTKPRKRSLPPPQLEYSDDSDMEVAAKGEELVHAPFFISITDI